MVGHQDSNLEARDYETHGEKMGGRRLFRKIRSLLQKCLAVIGGNAHGSAGSMALRRAECLPPVTPCLAETWQSSDTCKMPQALKNHRDTSLIDLIRMKVHRNRFSEQFVR